MRRLTIHEAVELRSARRDGRIYFATHVEADHGGHFVMLQDYLPIDAYVTPEELRPSNPRGLHEVLVYSHDLMIRATAPEWGHHSLVEYVGALLQTRRPDGSAIWACGDAILKETP